MPITRTPIIDDDGSGTTGTVIDAAWKTELYDQIDGIVTPITPTWQDVPFNAANFKSESGMVWTVGSGAVVRNRYARVGGILFWSFYISWFSGGNVLSGTPGGVLIMTLPAGLSGGSQVQIIAGTYGMAGVPAMAGLSAEAASGGIRITKPGGSNFALSDVPGMITTLIYEAY